MPNSEIKKGHTYALRSRVMTFDASKSMNKHLGYATMELPDI